MHKQRPAGLSGAYESLTHRKVHVKRQLWSEGLELLQARCIARGVECVHHLPDLHICSASCLGILQFGLILHSYSIISGGLIGR